MVIRFVFHVGNKVLLKVHCLYRSICIYIRTYHNTYIGTYIGIYHVEMVVILFHFSYWWLQHTQSVPTSTCAYVQMKGIYRSSKRKLTMQYIRTYKKNLIHNYPTCYVYSVQELIRALNLKKALDEDTGVFSSFFSLLSSSSPLGQTAISGNFTLHQ